MEWKLKMENLIENKNMRKISTNKFPCYILLNRHHEELTSNDSLSNVIRSSVNLHRWSIAVAHGRHRYGHIGGSNARFESRHLNKQSKLVVKDNIFAQAWNVRRVKNLDIFVSYIFLYPFFFTPYMVYLIHNN